MTIVNANGYALLPQLPLPYETFWLLLTYFHSYMTAVRIQTPGRFDSDVRWPESFHLELGCPKIHYQQSNIRKEMSQHIHFGFQLHNAGRHSLHATHHILPTEKSIIVSAAQQTLTSMSSIDKLTDLHKDTIDSCPKDHETPPGLTTDYGVKVSATNNWYFIDIICSV